MSEYTFTNGQTIEYDIEDPELDAYLSQVREAAQRPDISANELIDIIYDPDNPIMESDVIPGRGVIAEEYTDHPAYRIMLDQLQIKRTQQSDAEFQSKHAERPPPQSENYEVSVPDAADQLGISESAVRQAIYSDRLEAKKKGSTWRLDPNSVDSYSVGNRGPDRDETGEPLDVSFGSRRNLSFSIVHDGSFEAHDREVNVYYGELVDWTCAAIKQTVKHEEQDTVTYLEIEPEEDEVEIKMDEFRVEGEFRIETVITGHEEALEAFSEFQDELPDDS